MKNIIGGIVAACIIIALIPLGAIGVGVFAVAALIAAALVIFGIAAVVYHVATGTPSSLIEYERTVESTDENGRTTRRVFRSVNGKTEITEEVGP